MKKILLSFLSVACLSSAAWAVPGSLYFSSHDVNSATGAESVTASITGVSGKQIVINNIIAATDSLNLTIDIQTTPTSDTFVSRAKIFSMPTTLESKQFFGQNGPIYVAPAGHTVRVLVNTVTQGSVSVAGELN